MNSQNFISAAEKLRALLTLNLPTINEQMAMNATAMVKDRVINTGIDGEGKSLGKYSTNEVPLFFYKNGKLMAPFSNPLNGAGEQFFLSVKAANKKRPKGTPPRGISYEEWRAANNRPTDHVTLSFSGTTMKDIGPVKQIVDGNKVVTRVGSKNTVVRGEGTTTDDVVSGLGERYGNFLKPNQDETEKLKVFLQNEVIKIINDSFK